MYLYRFAVMGVCLVWVLAGSATGQRSLPVIAVADVHSAFRAVDGPAVRLAIENTLARTGKFKLMERARLNTLLQERGLSVQGIADGTASLGGFSGVDYLVYGNVVDATFAIRRKFGSRSCLATAELNVRTVDVNTGEIRASESVDFTAEVASVPTILKAEDTPEDPCSLVTPRMLERHCRDAGVELAAKITTALFPIKIVRVNREDHFLNYGSAALARGDYLKVVKLGEGFVDPDTGETLGAEEEDLAFLAVRDVRSKYSIAEVALSLSPNESVQVGDVALKLNAVEAKALTKRLKDLQKAGEKRLKNLRKEREKRERDCRKAQERAGKRCKKDENSPKCIEAREAVARFCSQ